MAIARRVVRAISIAVDFRDAETLDQPGIHCSGTVFFLLIGDIIQMDYNAFSLKQLRETFASLPVPDAASLAGVHRAAFVGPVWWRASAAPILALTGLWGWWGKQFRPDGTALNIVLRAGKFSTRFPMKVVQAKSFIDGREGMVLHYQAGNPFPWMYIVDELRRIDDTTLLGMTLANLNGLRRLALPFTLQFEEGNHERYGL